MEHVRKILFFIWHLPSNYFIFEENFLKLGLYGMGVVYVHVYVWRPDEGALTLEEDLLREGYSYTVVLVQLKIFVFVVESF